MQISEREKERRDLNGAVEDTAEADPILEDLVDMNNGVVRFIRSAVGYIVNM